LPICNSTREESALADATPRGDGLGDAVDGLLLGVAAGEVVVDQNREGHDAPAGRGHVTGERVCSSSVPVLAHILPLNGAFLKRLSSVPSTPAMGSVSARPRPTADRCVRQQTRESARRNFVLGAQAEPS